MVVYWIPRSIPNKLVVEKTKKGKEMTKEMTPDDSWKEVLEARANIDFWKAQTRLYMIELAKVNRACSRKSWLIVRLRAEIGWLKHDIDLLNKELSKKKIIYF